MSEAPALTDALDRALAAAMDRARAEHELMRQEVGDAFAEQLEIANKQVRFRDAKLARVQALVHRWRSEGAVNLVDKLATGECALELEKALAFSLVGSEADDEDTYRERTTDHDQADADGGREECAALREGRDGWTRYCMRLELAALELREAVLEFMPGTVGAVSRDRLRSALDAPALAALPGVVGREVPRP